MRYYISSAISNHGRVKTLSDELDKLGHVCAHNNLDKSDVRTKSESDITEAAFNIVQSVRDTELFLFITPAVRSTYVELGLALSSRYGKRIIVWSETGREFEPGLDACLFYFHPSVIRLKCSFSELIDYIKTI